MDIIIKRLSKETMSDYLDFFDCPTSSNDPLFAGCYCVWHHWTDELEHERSNNAEEDRLYFKRNLAAKLIEKGELNGFLAYSNEKVIGWCNADSKQSYDRLSKKRSPELWTELADSDNIFAIVCFIVHPHMQRKGVATELLKIACKEAKAKGYDYVEAYPDSHQYSMYTKQGFKLIQHHSSVIALKKL